MTDTINPPQYKLSDYPPPRVPNTPILSFGYFLGGRARQVSSVLDVGDSVLLTSGRDAIATALKEIGVESKSAKVLLPAYNCKVMVEAVLGVQAEPVLYRIHPDLTVDLDDIRAKIRNGVEALIVVHYFGFPQQLSDLRKLCDETGVSLIEDCAHAFYGDFDGSPPGAVGDYAIASLMKFFPIYDGGCLVSRHHPLRNKPPGSGGLRFEIKAIINILERSVEYARLRPINWLLMPLIKLKDLVWRRTKMSNKPLEMDAVGPGAADGGYGFDPSWLKVRISRISELIFKRSSALRCTNKRRENFRYFMDAFDNISGCRPIFTKLPDGVYPYVYPLYIDNPEFVFPLIKMQGVPMFRWEDVENGVCDNASLYSQHLLQFPCHEEIREDERDWICDTVTGVLTSNLR